MSICKECDMLTLYDDDEDIVNLNSCAVHKNVSNLQTIS